MASLPDLLQLIGERAQLDAGLIAAVEREIRQRWGGERVYVAPPGSRKDPARAERIRDLARTLPTGVVAQRLGVSAAYVYRVARRKE